VRPPAPPGVFYVLNSAGGPEDRPPDASYLDRPGPRLKESTVTYLESIRDLINQGEGDASLIAQKVAADLPAADLRNTLAVTLVHVAREELRNLRREVLHPVEAPESRSEARNTSGKSPRPQSRTERFFAAGNGPLDAPAPFPSIIGVKRLREMTLADCQAIAEAYFGEARANTERGERWTRLGTMVEAAGVATLGELSEAEVLEALR
jgi:hypothetical protein